MILPTLVLVTSMQFAAPQSGEKIDDLSHTSWQNIPIPASALVSVTPVVYTRQSEEPQAGVVPNVAPSAIVSPSENKTEFVLDVPDPDIAGRENRANIQTPTVPLLAGGSGRFPDEYKTSISAASQNSNTGTNGLVGYSARVAETLTVINGDNVLGRGKVEYDKISRLSAPIGGNVQQLQTPKYDKQGKLVKNSAGDPVWIDLVRGVVLYKGQQICLLDDRYPKAQYEVATTKLSVAKVEAEKDIDIRFAEKKFETAQRNLKRSYESNERVANTVSPAEIDILTLQRDQSLLEIEKSQSDQDTRRQEVKVQEQEVAVALTQLDLRRVKTPFNSMVIGVFTQEGSYLREGDPVAEVAQLDKLKVTCTIDGKKLRPEEIDQKKVTITASYPNGQKENFDGFVRYAASSYNDLKEFQTEIEVTNRNINGYWLLKQGDFVEVTIHLK
ncbi:MAG: HlyD family efflux transporter periplasmic adaptor subunit [Planctomycetaceae bacterium]|jgi:biotin carboxyl carrier protein|nr:HlyD family efflux transporter periplasmic adaptor subunit [Planctomycetaceae bacterium]